MKKLITLLSAATAMVFAVACNGTTAAETSLDGKWTMVSMDGTAVELGEQQPVILFDAEGYHASIVNILNGTYSLEDGVLTLAAGAMTKMMGPAEAMQVEDRFVQIIANPLQVILEEGVLTLTAEDGSTMTFKLAE